MGKRKGVSRAVTIGGLVAIAAIVAFMVSMQVEAGRNNDFKKSIDAIAFDAISLTREYQAEEGKWTNNEYDNSTMVGVIERYDTRYQELVDRANALDTPEKYRTAREYLVKALESEKQSNLHLRNYISNGSQEEYEKSIDLFSLSLQYSADYDAAIKAAG
jgi:hypothetical protein